MILKSSVTKKACKLLLYFTYEASTFSLQCTVFTHGLWNLRLTLIFALLFHTSQFKSHVAILNLFTTSALRAVDGFSVRPLTHESQLVSSAVILKVKHSDWLQSRKYLTYMMGHIPEYYKKSIEQAHRAYCLSQECVHNSKEGCVWWV